MASPGVVLGAATAAQASVSLVAFGLPSIGPELQSDFGVGLPLLGMILTANLLGAGLFLIAGGVAVDRYGARWTTLAGAALGTAGLTAAAFAPSVAVLVAMLFLSGVGSSIVPIAGIGTVFRAYPVTRRAWALGVRQMGVPLGGVTAAVLLPPLAGLGGTRLAFLTAAGALTVFAATFAVLAGDVRHLAAERPRSELRRILRLPGMPRLLLVAAFYIVVLQSVLVYSVPSARDAGLSAITAGVMFFAIQVTAGVARIVWGRIADREDGGRRARTLSDAGWVAVGGGVAFAAALHGGPVVVVLAAILFAFGALGWNALVYVAAGEKAPFELAAQAVAIAATLIFVLSAATTPPMGALAARVGWDAFWLVTAGLATCGALLATSLIARRPAAAGERS